MRTVYRAGMAGTSWVVLLISSAGAATPERSSGGTPAPRAIGSHTGGVASTHFSPDGRFLASGGGDKMIRIWDAAASRLKYEWAGPSAFTCAVRFSPDGKLLAAGGYESGRPNVIYLFDTATGKVLPPLPGHPSGGARRLAFTPDGKQLVSGGFDGTVRVWDLDTRKEVRRIKAEAGTVYSMELSRDGQAVATAGRDGLKLWELATGKPLHREPVASGTCFAAAFSPDGKLVAGGDGSRVTLYETLTGKEVLSLRGFKGELSQLVFSADGRSLVTSSYDRTVRLWEVRTGRLVHQAEHHTGWVWGVALSPDEKQIASCGIDSKLLCWDASAFLGRPTSKPAAAPAARLTSKEVAGHVANLASADASAAYRAVCALAANPEQGLPAIRKRLEAPAEGPMGKGPSSADISRMVRDLDSDLYPVRDRASKDLAQVGARALPALRRALTHPPSVEVRLRARRLLARLDPSEVPAEELLARRGVQALEYMNTPEARRLLEKLSRGEPGDRLSEEAGGALLRLRPPAAAAAVGVPAGNGS